MRRCGTDALRARRTTRPAPSLRCFRSPTERAPRPVVLSKNEIHRPPPLKLYPRLVIRDCPHILHRRSSRPSVVQKNLPEIMRNNVRNPTICREPGVPFFTSSRPAIPPLPPSAPHRALQISEKALSVNFSRPQLHPPRGLFRPRPSVPRSFRLRSFHPPPSYHPLLTTLCQQPFRFF